MPQRPSKLMGPFTRCMSRWILRTIFLTIFFTLIFMVYDKNQNGSSGLLKKNITILLWHWPYGTQYNLTGDVCQKDYGISRCSLEDNHKFYESADLVVFHHFELKMKRQHLPLDRPRPATQKWVWLSLEAPQNNGDLWAYKNLFNLTMSYHPQADITVPYGKMLPREKPGLDFVISNNKSYEACWVVSNFKRRHKRSTVFQELKKNLNVQLYGLFAKKKLPKEMLLSTISGCYFYLAFENIESPHYITEKLWRNAFQAGTVPVVLGPPRRDYEAVAPPTSFIHVDDFKSIKALAKYLRDLTKDPEKYNAYFTWRQNYTVKLYTDWRERLCNICPIYGQFPTQKVYEDLRTLSKW
ncbi:alpha-(1,3)-fucosyltransferase 7 [Xyrauchen texanus]|uniref:alpha-(1,3)-fucosyltransferase 7 n=1 Tax=Xyrauchen texanus TaxID=154827 RepID=UPI0022427A78|nr:alpha-(1,3)-fucosyltransferase 7 [Xyrauchen texanus]